MGGGIYELEYTIATVGTYPCQVVDTGSWDAIGTDVRSVNTDTLAFTTTNEKPLVDFFANALNGTIKADVVPEPASMAFLGFCGLASLLAIRRRK